MKKSAALILIILVAVSGPACAEKILKVVTVNVWSGLTYSGALTSGTYESREERSFRYGLLVNALRELDADIIGINEANMLPGYAKTLARDLDCDYIYAVRFGGIRLGQAGFPMNLREGQAILAKKLLNLSPAGNRALAGGYAGNFASFHVRDAQRILAGKVTVGEREVFLFSAGWHASEFSNDPQLKNLVDLYSKGRIEGLELLARMQDAIDGHEERLIEAAKTVEYIAEVAKENAVVLMGTLNALPDSSEIAILADAGFNDVWKAGRGDGYTRDGMRNTNIIKYFSNEQSAEEPRRDRIDYIFFKGDGVTLMNAAIALDEATFEIHPSDHFAVVAELEF